MPNWAWTLLKITGGALSILVLVAFLIITIYDGSGGDSGSADTTYHPNNPPDRLAERPAFVPPPSPCDGKKVDLPVTSRVSIHGDVCNVSIMVLTGEATIGGAYGSLVIKPVAPDTPPIDVVGKTEWVEGNVPGTVVRYTPCPDKWVVVNFQCVLKKS